MASSFTLERRTYSFPKENVFVLKRKNFDDSENQSHTGRNIALGLLGTAALGAGGFAMARRGHFGGTAQMATNKAWNRLGQRFKSEGMIKSGYEKYQQGFNKVMEKNPAKLEGQTLEGLMKEGGLARDLGHSNELKAAAKAAEEAAATQGATQATQAATQTPAATQSATQAAATQNATQAATQTAATQNATQAATQRPNQPSVLSRARIKFSKTKEKILDKRDALYNRFGKQTKRQRGKMEGRQKATEVSNRYDQNVKNSVLDADAFDSGMLVRDTSPSAAYANMTAEDLRAAGMIV